MAALHRDPVRGAPTSPPAGPAPATPPGTPPGTSPGTPPGTLPPASTLALSRLGTLAAVAGIVAVVLVTADAPAAIRAPVVLLAALLLPGFPLVARLRADLATVVAADVCVSLALGLALAAFGVGGTMSTLAGLRQAEARHLT